MKLGRLLADELARIFWQKGTYVDYVDNYVEKWLEWPERPLIST